VERVNIETGEIISNQYGEIVGKVEGVEIRDKQQIKTRLHVWRIQAKASVVPPEAAFNAVVEYVQGFDLLTPFPSSSAPWSTVNNCTPDDQTGGIAA